ncbi:growth hormone-regulated TBC protein 1 [Scaptodrosophila lebanonensis]|uniref:Growth hormone-regulated TBC protein 1 n=1 Tax=Drosophila lebanonensis TaxID=7225 RepID=A0A6J2TL03_DROLE|nr:growth hormone-regulated TBC protein 1 [Scaptodrosophila lebanonensis]XP_030375818.1 growth hormone-regulated TBC protein 1 [Scaptodrosophila lebanonensis]
MEKSTISDIDPYGFKRGANFDYENYSKFFSTYLKVLAGRETKWKKLLEKKGDLSNVDRSVLKRYIRKGVPLSYRAAVWMETSGAAAQQKSSPGLYTSLLKIEHFNKEISDSILIDLPRTFPDNIKFDTKRLNNVLLAYAHHNQDVGYCQGLNYIAGLLLIVTNDEEKSFWLLKHIVEKILPQYHTKNMANLLRDLAVFKELIIRRYPDLNRHVEALGLPYPVIATKWFICIFAEVLPVETVFRIWDCVFAEGYKIVFRAALAMFVSHKDVILSCQDIGALAPLFRDSMTQDSIVTDCHSFIKTMFALRLKRSELENLRKVCNADNI